MNKDFHYYGTYVAAIFAGYNKVDATTIAHAAQYVDDSNSSRLLQTKITDFTLIPTVHKLSSMVITDFFWTESSYNELLKVWPVFHFLPGNYTIDNGHRKPYLGKRSDTSFFGAADTWAYDKQAEGQFKLVCLPNSILTKTMVNDLIQKYQNNLHAIGLRMHVLADTWAHTYHAGIPAWFLNQEKANYLQNAKTFNDILYLGHASTGYKPDNPSLTFEPGMQWNNYTKVSKNNPEDYLKAIKQMVQAMVCIRTNSQFENDTYFEIGGILEEKISNILKTVTEGDLNDQTEVWKAKIGELSVPGGAPCEVPDEYNEDAWMNIVKNGSLSSEAIKETDYYKFNLAAVQHLAFVKTTLSYNHIYLDDVPDEWVFRYDIKDGLNKYVSNIYNGINYFYPTYSTTKPMYKLDFVFPFDESATLNSGDIAYIKTREEYSHLISGSARYLGAWADSTDIYFYAKEYNPAKQKWIIEQNGKNVGEVIDMTKPVWIKNVFYTDKPYLAPHDSYLTTQSDKYEWYLIP